MNFYIYYYYYLGLNLFLILIFSSFPYRLEFAREFPMFGRPQTLRTRGFRGVGFSRASVARVWRVLGRSNPGNSRADVI